MGPFRLWRRIASCARTRVCADGSVQWSGLSRRCDFRRAIHPQITCQRLCRFQHEIERLNRLTGPGRLMKKLTPGVSRVSISSGRRVPGATALATLNCTGARVRLLVAVIDPEIPEFHPAGLQEFLQRLSLIAALTPAMHVHHHNPLPLPGGWHRRVEAHRRTPGRMPARALLQRMPSGLRLPPRTPCQKAWQPRLPVPHHRESSATVARRSCRRRPSGRPRSRSQDQKPCQMLYGLERVREYHRHHWRLSTPYRPCRHRPTAGKKSL